MVYVTLARVSNERLSHVTVKRVHEHVTLAVSCVRSLVRSNHVRHCFNSNAWPRWFHMKSNQASLSECWGNAILLTILQSALCSRRKVFVLSTIRFPSTASEVAFVRLNILVLWAMQPAIIRARVPKHTSECLRLRPFRFRNERRLRCFYETNEPTRLQV